MPQLKTKTVRYQNKPRKPDAALAFALMKKAQGATYASILKSAPSPAFEKACCTPNIQKSLAPIPDSAIDVFSVPENKRSPLPQPAASTINVQKEIEFVKGAEKDPDFTSSVSNVVNLVETRSKSAGAKKGIAPSQKKRRLPAHLRLKSLLERLCDVVIAENWADEQPNVAWMRGGAFNAPKHG